MTPPLPNELLTALRNLDACALANVIESFQVRLRNEGFADASLHAILPDLPPCVGYAATLTVRGASPPIGGRTYLDRTDWWDAILALPAPRIVVVQDVSSQIGHGALLGEVHLNILRALGCVGAVTNGSVRDVPAAAALGFPLVAGGLSVSHSYVHIVELGEPVEVGGLAVRAGDLVHFDRHGVQTVPPQIAAAIPARAAQFAARERALIALCRAPDFSIAKLRAAVAEPRARSQS
jgi:4-hydroxy-4-methyl-2-oxoglutarate aldolase